MAITVLAIDDSRTMRNLLYSALTRAGFTVDLEPDGSDGLRKFTESDPDVVVTDINMPNLDGFGFIEAARSLKRERIIPILVLTTENAPTLKERARKAGANGWIEKPFDEENLIWAIKKVVDTSGLNQ